MGKYSVRLALVGDITSRFRACLFSRRLAGKDQQIVTAKYAKRIRKGREEAQVRELRSCLLISVGNAQNRRFIEMLS
jgi:hypothetical protein